jgi:hypothetical protein
VFNLSLREAEFAQLFAAGNRLEIIAQIMGVAMNTAAFIFATFAQKLGAPARLNSPEC